MPTLTTERISGFCPETNSEKNIYVNFLEGGSLDKSNSVRQKKDFECDNYLNGKCKYFAENGSCPIFQDIPFTSESN